MNARDGGPAFPGAPEGWNEDGTVRAFGGMSLRDYAAIEFAAAWVPVLEVRCRQPLDCRVTDADVAEEACRLGLIQADAMLAARAARSTAEPVANELPKPSRYPWHNAPVWAEYAATDTCGNKCWFAFTPTYDGRNWAAGDCNEFACFAYGEPGQDICADAADSLEARP